MDDAVDLLVEWVGDREVPEEPARQDELPDARTLYSAEGPRTTLVLELPARDDGSDGATDETADSPTLHEDDFLRAVEATLECLHRA